MLNLIKKTFSIVLQIIIYVHMLSIDSCNRKGGEGWGARVIHIGDGCLDTESSSALIYIYIRYMRLLPLICF